MEQETKYTIKDEKTADLIWEEVLSGKYGEAIGPESVYMEGAYFDTPDRVLKKNTAGLLVLFNRELLQQPLTIRFDIYSSRPQDMEVSCSNEKKTVKLNVGRSWYEVTFNKPGDVFNFIVSDEDIKIYQYELSCMDEK